MDTSDDILDKIASIQEQGLLTDFTVICQSRRWEVHRLVLIAQSDYFMKACTSNFQESLNRSINLDDDPIHCIDALIYYLYHQTYEIPPTATSDAPPYITSPLTFLVEMTILADKYGLVTLQKSLEDDFTSQIQKDPLASDDCASAIATAYECPHPTASLRYGIVQHVLDKDLLSPSADTARLENIMRDCPDFAIDITKAMRSRLKKETRYQCPSGGQHSVVIHIPDEWARTRVRCAVCGRSFSAGKWRWHVLV